MLNANPQKPELMILNPVLVKTVFTNKILIPLNVNNAEKNALNAIPIPDV